MYQLYLKVMRKRVMFTNWKYVSLLFDLFFVNIFVVFSASVIVNIFENFNILIFSG